MREGVGRNETAAVPPRHPAPRLAAVRLAACTSAGRLGLSPSRLAPSVGPEMSRLICARDVGSGISRASVRSVHSCHSALRAFGFSLESLLYSLAGQISKSKGGDGKVQTAGEHPQEVCCDVEGWAAYAGNRSTLGCTDDGRAQWMTSGSYI